MLSLCSPDMRKQTSAQAGFPLLKCVFTRLTCAQNNLLCQKIFTPFKYSQRPQLSLLATFLMGLNRLTSSKKLLLMQSIVDTFWETNRQFRYFFWRLNAFLYLIFFFYLKLSYSLGTICSSGKNALWEKIQFLNCLSNPSCFVSVFTAK